MLLYIYIYIIYNNIYSLKYLTETLGYCSHLGASSYI